MVWNDFNPRSRQGFLKVGSISSLATILWHPINIALGPFIPIAAGSGWVSWGLPAGCKVLSREPAGRARGRGAASWGRGLCPVRAASPPSPWPLRFPTAKCANLKQQLGVAKETTPCCFLVETGSWCSGWVCGGQGMFEWGCPSHQQSWRGAPRMSPCTTELGPSEGGSWTQKTGQRE